MYILSQLHRSLSHRGKLSGHTDFLTLRKRAVSRKVKKERFHRVVKALWYFGLLSVNNDRSSDRGVVIQLLSDIIGQVHTAVRAVAVINVSAEV